MIQFLAKNSIQLSSLQISSGERIIYVTDTEDVYIEKNGTRTQFRDIIYLQSTINLPIAPLNKIYFTLSDRLMRYYYNGQWQILNSSDGNSGNTTIIEGNAITLEFGSRLGSGAETKLNYAKRI